MGYYILPENLRRVLSLIHIYVKDHVQLITGSREFVGVELRSELYTYLHRVAVIGDIVCNTFLEYVGMPRICVIDGKTLREVHGYVNSFLDKFNEVFKCRNPPSSISTECIDVIAKALDNFVPKLVLVDGEEDLLALVVTLIGRGVDFVVFGIPREGVGLINVEGFKITAINFFSQFKFVEEL